MIGGGFPLLRENLVNTDPPLQKADFQSIFACSASAVTPSKKVQLTLIGSPLRAFRCTSVRRLTVARKQLLILDIRW